MNRNTVKQISLGLALAMGLTGLFTTGADARAKYTISKRINALSWKINAGQRSGDLTLKEANSLRDDIGDINRKINRMKSKNGGKLSYDNQNSIEKDLNKLSLRLQKRELNKRVD